MRDDRIKEKVEYAAKRMNKAKEAMSAAVNKMLPVGMAVIAATGHGWMHGVISSPANWLDPEYINVRCDNSGKIHRKYWKDIEVLR